MLYTARQRIRDRRRDEETYSFLPDKKRYREQRTCREDACSLLRFFLLTFNCFLVLWLVFPPQTWIHPLAHIKNAGDVAESKVGYENRNNAISAENHYLHAKSKEAKLKKPAKPKGSTQQLLHDLDPYLDPLHSVIEDESNERQPPESSASNNIGKALTKAKNKKDAISVKGKVTDANVKEQASSGEANSFNAAEKESAAGKGKVAQSKSQVSSKERSVARGRQFDPGEAGAGPRIAQVDKQAPIYKLVQKQGAPKKKQVARKKQFKGTLHVPVPVAPPGYEEAAKKRKIFHITHIISSFREEASIHITYRSMLAAVRFARRSEKIEVQLMSIHYEEDDEIVPDGFYKFPNLRSSTFTSYGETFRKIPFVNDILRIGMRHSLSEYFVYTNNDIGLQENFYVEVYRKFQEHDAFVINRQTLPLSLMNGTLQQMYAFQGASHKGTDCFCWRRRLNEFIDLGNVFLGYPPIGTAFRAVLEHFAERFRQFNSSEHLTFHLGHATAWKPRSLNNRIHRLQNEKNTNALSAKLNFTIEFKSFRKRAKKLAKESAASSQ